MIEAKTRGSRKQRKEKKNRTKKVEILNICYLFQDVILVKFNRSSILTDVFRSVVPPRPRLDKQERR